jgi:TP901 family phage tail tape measure protein
MIGGGPQKITVEIGGKIAASLGKALRESQRQVSTFGRNVNRSMNDAAIAGKKGFKGIFDNALWQQASIGAAGIGLALAGSVRVAARFESVLADVGKTANVGGAELKKLSAQVLQLSGRNVTNLGPEKLAQGIQDLVAQGLNLNDAVASMETLGRVATATGSDLLDVTKTGFQLQNALKIRPTELKSTFDALAFAGKQGAFELKDMAQFMPTIAAAAGTLGITGKQGAISLAAMMQMVRKDAPDAGQASTRLTDAMLKMTAPDAVKRFKKFGVNIEQVLNDAKAKGINPMEAALDQLQAVTGGDVFKLGQIFGDKEAKLGLMSLMKYRKEYQKLKADAGGAAAAGTVDQDFERSIKTLQGTLISFQNSTQRLGVAVGNSLLPPLTALAGVITPLAEGFAGFAASNPRIATGIVLIVGALAGLVIALPIIAGVVQAIGTIKLALAGLKIGATIAGFLPAILNPIGLIIAGVVLVGAALVAAYKYFPWFRDAVNAVWGGIVAGFQSSIGAIKAGWQGFTTYLGGAWKVFTGFLTGDLGRMKEGFGQAFSGIKQIAKAWLGWFRSVLPSGVRGVFDRVVSFIKETPRKVANVGGMVIEAIINGLKAKAGALFGWIRNTWSNITGFFGGGAAPAPANGAAPAAASSSPGRNAAGGGRRPPGRALGGPVTAGMPYIVGEKRRELFVPGMDGAIIPRVARPAAPPININPPVARQAPTPAPITINAPVTINATGDGAGIRDQVRAAFEDLMAMASSGYRVALND